MGRNWGLTELPTVVQETQIRLLMEAEVDRWLQKKREAQRVAAWTPPVVHRVACRCRNPRGLLAGDPRWSVFVCQICHLPIEQTAVGTKVSAA